MTTEQAILADFESKKEDIRERLLKMDTDSDTIVTAQTLNAKPYLVEFDTKSEQFTQIKFYADKYLGLHTDFEIIEL